MKKNTVLAIALGIFMPLLFNPGLAKAQDEDPAPKAKLKGIKRFQAGLYFASYFANDYSASLYDGYGFDVNGTKNTFMNSALYKRIVNDYGGYAFPGQFDYIAQALGVNHGEWTFDETDMPAKMIYSPAFMLGINMRYMLNRQNAVILNVNGAVINISGDFTIGIQTPTQTAQTPGYQKFSTFSIRAREQRLALQLGFQHICGDEESTLNFFYEGGLAASLSRFDRSQATINNLQIDLGYYYTTPDYGASRPSNLQGLGFGVFGGGGLNISVNPKLIMQLMYSPSYETINIGENPKPTFQQSVGLRVYGKL